MIDRKLTHALDGILKISGNPTAYAKTAGMGGDWSTKDMFRIINERTRTIVRILEEEGIIKVESDG